MFRLTIDPAIPESTLPTRGSPESAGWDLYSPISTTIEPHSTLKLDTGIRCVELPDHTYARIASRSGLASRHIIQVLAGVVDRDYKGNISVLLHNFGAQAYDIERGDRIAQFILETYDDTEYVVVVDNKGESSSTRGSAGFGSTGR